MLMRFLGFVALLHPLLAFSQKETPAQQKKTLAREKRDFTDVRNRRLFDSSLLKGRSFLEAIPQLNLLLSQDEQRYGLGATMTYGRFLTNHFALRAGLLYEYTWLRNAPERFNAHTIAPIIGATLHAPVRWRIKPFLAADLRYDVISYLPEGRFVYFNDKPDGKRVWHTLPATRLTAGLMFPATSRLSLGLNIALEKQFYRNNQIPPAFVSQNAFSDNWLTAYLVNIRYTLRP